MSGKLRNLTIIQLHKKCGATDERAEKTLLCSHVYYFTETKHSLFDLITNTVGAALIF